MARAFFEIGVVVAKKPLKGPWASHAWRAIAALSPVPPVAPGTQLTTMPEETYYLGSAEVSLHLRATSHYRDNLTAAQPSLWVQLRPNGDEVELAAVTADPYEGEGLAEMAAEFVEAVPMPPSIQARVQAFFDAFHVEQTFVKRQRDRADPEALGRRGIGGERGRRPGEDDE
jgi:uncharacterized protein DUF3305